MDYSIIIAAVIALCGLGVIFAVGLAVANAKLAVKQEPLVEKILAVLPGANCGACGYGGCAGFAEAAAAGKVAPDGCILGQAEVARKVAEILGKEADPREKRIAVVGCQRPPGVKPAVEYGGLEDCRAAGILTNSLYECAWACTGLGTCARACPFGAIVMTEEGLPYIMEEKCTGCGKCAEVCPKGIIGVERESATVHILCRSRDRGAVARRICERACVACGACAKICPSSAVEIRNFLAEIDYSKCTSCGKCVTVCPTGAIGNYSGMRRRKANVA